MFSRIDLFGKPVVLNFNGKGKSQSSTGAWFTLILFGFIAWAIYELGQDLVDRENPKTITSELFEEDPSPMIISPDTFNFAFGLQHPTTFEHYKNESIYTIEASREQLKRVLNEDGSVEMKWTNTPLLMETCTKDDFGSLGPKFENLELNSLYCLKRNQSELADIRIQGVFESPLYELISIQIRQCNNQTSKVGCAPPAALDALLGGGWFATYFTNVAIEPKNYSYPNIGYRDSHYTSMSNTYFKEVTLWLGHIEVSSDYGWVTKEMRHDNFIKIDHIQEYISFRPEVGHMMTFNIRVGKITKHYERSYIKIQDLVAQANGFISAGLIIGLIILIPYSNIKFYERLINELFDVKLLKKNLKDRKYTRKRTQRILSSIIVDGDNSKIENQENQQNLIGDLNKKNDLNYEPSPLSSSHTQNHTTKLRKYHNPFSPENDSRFRKYSSPSGSIKEDVKPRKYSSPSPLKNHSFAEKRHSMSNETKEVKFLKIDTCPSDNGKEGYRKDHEKKHTDLNRRRTSSNSYSISSYLLKGRPKRSYKPQIKILETFEVQSPGESFIVSEKVADNLKAIQPTDLENPRQNNSNPIKNNANNFLLKMPKIDSKGEQAIDEEEINKRADMLPSQLTKDSYKINITFWEYVRSFFWRSKHVKEKFGLLAEGIRRIEERLNIFNLLKKLREVDKLKLLLLENEQFVLFDALPNPELSVNTDEIKRVNSNSSTHNQLKEAKFIAEKRKHELVKLSYIDLKKKQEPTMIDEKLLEIYDDIIDF